MEVNDVISTTSVPAIFSEITDWLMKSIPTSEWETVIPQKIKSFLNDNPCVYNLDLDHYEIPQEESYLRIPIEYEKTKPWEFMLAKWLPGKIGPIHGHPAFTYYCVLSGAIEMELYNENLDLEKKILMYSSDSIFHLGELDSYSNFIHRIRPLKKTITLHLYSSCALQGVVYK